MEIWLECIYNFGLLIMLSILSGYIRIQKPSYNRMVQGILFGSAAIMGMVHPFIFSEGLFFDGRTILLSLAGYFYGLEAVAIAGTMAGLYRFYQGGIGLIPGLLTILSASIVGLVFHKDKCRKAFLRKIMSIGFITHLLMLISMLALPKADLKSTLIKMGPIIIIIYPLVTIIAGYVLKESIERMNLAVQLKSQILKLESSEERFRKIFENSPIGINLVDRKTGRFLQVNPQFCKMLGMTSDELLKKTWMDVTHSEGEVNDLKQNRCDNSSSVDVIEVEKRYYKADGDTCWVNIKVTDYKYTHQKDDVQLCFAEDISDKKAVQEALLSSEYTFRSLFESTSDPIIIIKNEIITDCNKAAILSFGKHTKEDIIGKHPWFYAPFVQPDGEKSMEKFMHNIALCKQFGSAKFEWWQSKCNGLMLPVECVFTQIQIQGKYYIHALNRDITERKRIEKSLHHMSYLDQLTEVWNRRYFEDCLSSMDLDNQTPLSLIIADVNGLKLVNDSFGHRKGDDLLKCVVQILKESCRNEDKIFRIGGDEFAILLFETDATDVKKVVDRIRKTTSKYNMKPIEVSISCGWYTKESSDEDMRSVIKKAEDHMYKKKLFESPSIRSKTIDTIIKTLHEKNNREEKHSHRVAHICEVIGTSLQMSESEIKELKNLGLLHDIGKIAIEEYILNKPGPLSHEERSEIQKHPEIGYRILSTVNEMSEMAEHVLYHHERWDGKGYPRGLKEFQIPRLARIISIADTYDAMTSDRSYRRALSHETAVHEIILHSGTQFDPELVNCFKRCSDQLLDIPEYIA